MESKTNYFGKKLDMCISLSSRIANGRLNNDSLGAFKFMDPRGSSVIEYVLPRGENFNLITRFNVDSYSVWSDHGPLLFNIKCNTALSRSVK
jgi:hypothetical protein